MEFVRHRAALQRTALRPEHHRAESFSEQRHGVRAPREARLAGRPERRRAQPNSPSPLTKRSIPTQRRMWSGEGIAPTTWFSSPQALGPELTIGTCNYAIAAAVAGQAEALHARGHGRSLELHRREVERIPSSDCAVSPCPRGDSIRRRPGGHHGTAASSFRVAGDADLARALQVARALGIDTPRVAAKGDANLDLHRRWPMDGLRSP